MWESDVLEQNKYFFYIRFTFPRPGFQIIFLKIKAPSLVENIYIYFLVIYDFFFKKIVYVLWD